MILGIGHDLVDMTRLRQAWQRFGQRFLDRIFTPAEQEKALIRSDPLPVLARRFAAKEACAKALGCGIGAGAFWNEMEVYNSASGQPALKLSGRAAGRLAAMTPIGHKAVVHISLSDEVPFASAFVVIESQPESAP